MTAFYLTLFKPLKPGDAEWHMEWTLCDWDETVDAICGGDFADFKVSRVLEITPSANSQSNGLCRDMSFMVAHAVCQRTHEKEYVPDEYTRTFLEDHGYVDWYGNDDDEPRDRSDYREHNVLNRAQQF